MNARLTIALSVAMAIAAMALGCGGGGGASTSSGQGGTDGSTQSAATTTESTQAGAPAESTPEGTSGKEVFVAEANAACKKEGKDLFEEVNTYAERTGKEGVQHGASLAETVRAVVLPVVEAEIASVRALEAPAGDEKQVEAMLAAQQAAVEEVRKLKSLQSFADVEDHFAAAAKKLNSYGLAECAL